MACLKSILYGNLRNVPKFLCSDLRDSPSCVDRLFVDVSGLSCRFSRTRSILSSVCAVRRLLASGRCLLSLVENLQPDGLLLVLRARSARLSIDDKHAESKQWTIRCSIPYCSISNPLSLLFKIVKQKMKDKFISNSKHNAHFVSPVVLFSFTTGPIVCMYNSYKKNYGVSRIMCNITN